MILFKDINFNYIVYIGIITIFTVISLTGCIVNEQYQKTGDIDLIQTNMYDTIEMESHYYPELYAIAAQIPEQHYPVENSDETSLVTYLYYEELQSREEYGISLNYTEDTGEFADFHPFATIISDYLKGGIEVPDYWHVPDFRAFFVYIDGEGTQGVLALRYQRARFESPFDGSYSYSDLPWPFAGVFYIYENELFYINPGPQEAGFVTAITTENRLVNLMAEGGNASYTLFKLENSALIGDFTIFTAGFKTFYWFPGKFGSEEGWEYRRMITEEEFNSIKIEYGLDNLRDLLKNDDTDLILNMVSN